MPNSKHASTPGRRKSNTSNEAKSARTKSARAVAVGRSASSLRRTRALQIVFGEAPIVHIGGPIWEVPSETKGAVRYSVNMERLTCECPYWRDKRVVCKHIEAVRIYISHNPSVAEQVIEHLPNPYKNPPWYDRLAEQQFDILTLLLKSLGRALQEKVQDDSAETPRGDDSEQA